MATSPAAPMESDAGSALLFRALNAPVRRHILEALRTRDPNAESGVPVSTFVSDDEPGATRLQLRHTHLPLLDDYGLVDWSPEAGTVAPGPTLDEVEPVLALLSDHGDELPGTWP